MKVKKMIKKIKNILLMSVIIFIIPALLIASMQFFYFLIVGYSDQLVYINTDGVNFGKKVQTPDGIIYKILHIKACIIFSIISIISFYFTVKYKILYIIYFMIFLSSYVIANVFDYYNIIDNFTYCFYFTNCVSIIFLYSLYLFLKKGKNYGPIFD